MGTQIAPILMVHFDAIAKLVSPGMENPAQVFVKHTQRLIILPVWFPKFKNQLLCFVIVIVELANSFLYVRRDNRYVCVISLFNDANVFKKDIWFLQGASNTVEAYREWKI
jgi:hypothetical protein